MKRDTYFLAGMIWIGLGTAVTKPLLWLAGFVLILTAFWLWRRDDKRAQQVVAAFAASAATAPTVQVPPTGEVPR